MNRIASIRKAAGAHAEIAAKAVSEGWDETRTELEVLRASRPTGPAIHTGGSLAHVNAGLALDFGRLAIAPAWGFVAPSLLNAGLQAINSIDSNDDSYGDTYGDSYGSSYGGYDNAQYFDNAGDYAYSAPSYPALCGRYYSDENPGCRQEF